MNKLTVFTLFLLVLGILINSGCTAGKAAQVTDYNSLVTSLRDAGANVESNGTINQSFLSVQGRVIRVNSADVQVFEYPDENAANREAALVSADGGSVGTTMITWGAPPHFYKAGTIMV